MPYSLVRREHDRSLSVTDMLGEPVPVVMRNASLEQKFRRS